MLGLKVRNLNKDYRYCRKGYCHFILKVMRLCKDISGRSVYGFVTYEPFLL